MRPYLFFLTLLVSTTAFGQRENQKLMISPLVRDFYVYTTYGDPGDGSQYPANGMYVVTSKGVVLIDTPWDSTQFQPLLDSIKARHNQNVIMCISTHFHNDKTAGLTYYRQKGIKTYTTRLTDQFSKEKHEPRAAYLIDKDTTFTIGQHRFDTFYPGKGHSPDNIVIWFGSQKILYGGCFIKSTDTESPGNLSDASIDDWIISAEKVQAKFGTPNYVITGHLNWTNKQALAHTLTLLKKYRNSH